VAFIANRVRGDDDVRHVERLVGEPVFGALPVDEAVAAAERIGVAPIDYAPDAPAIVAIGRLVADLVRATDPA
jgi:hypothetical protein